MQHRPRRSLPISIEGVTRRFAATVALNDVHLDIRAGEFLTLLGPSGSGKTTLLMVLAGFVRPDAGRIRFGEREVSLVPPHKRNVGMVFQNYALFPHMSVLDNIAYPLRLRGAGRAEARERATRALEMMHMAGFGDRHADQLSGGQQQRVALARAIVFEPPILLMDEPLSALDKKLREAMQVEIRRVHDRVGATTVYVTHDQREALALSDRVAVVNDGRILQIDTPERIYQSPANLFVADFVGDAHFLPVECDGDRAMLGGRLLEHTAALPDGSRNLVLVLRPEKLELVGADADPGGNVLQGEVRHRVFFGDSIVLTVALDGGAEISVKLPTRHRVASDVPGAGTRVRLALHAEDTVLLPAHGDAARSVGGEP